MSKFIAIEGLDGSGKSTQIKLLKDYLTQKRIKFEYLHFPRVDRPFVGEMILRFLKGEFGDVNDVEPRLVAYLYAIDRNESKAIIDKWLNDNKIVLVDRYVYSNIAFQCAKVNSDEDKQVLKEWIIELEYKHFKIPKPDFSIYISAPFGFVSNCLKNNRVGLDRSYLNGSIDIHENDLSLQDNVSKEYIKLVDQNKDFESINCIDKKSEILPKEVIFNRIVNHLINRRIL